MPGGSAIPMGRNPPASGAGLLSRRWQLTPGLLGRSPGITALSAPPELFSVITRGILEWLLISELRSRSAGARPLLRETVEVVLRGALAPDGGTSGTG